MTGTRIDVHLVCGGRFHDFDFARLRLLELLAEHDRVRTTVSADYADTDTIVSADLLLTYTCDVRPTPPQQEVLVEHVARGGRWFALHGTNAALEQRPDRLFEAPRALGRVAEVLGSQFIAHPPIEPYEVENLEPEHPLVRGIGTFVTDDELYLCERHGVDQQTVLMATRWSGDTGPGFVEHEWYDTDLRPVVYLRRYEQGEVLYNTLGHCRGHYDMQPLFEHYPAVERGSWNRPEYIELLRRGIRWGLRSEP